MFWYLKSTECIFNYIKENKTIFGFHFMGNYGYVNADGFLIVEKDFVRNLSECTMMKRI